MARNRRGSAAKIKKIDFSVPLSQRIRLDKWQPSQTARFLHHIAGHRLAVLWKLYATIRTRRGELAGVGWFSYEGNIVAIESRLLKLAGPQPCDVCPVEHVGVRWQPGAKSGNGVRTIFLPSQLVWNDNPRPFIWTKTAEQILERLGRPIKRSTGAGR